MFGLFRLILAALVMYGHLVAIHGFRSHYAVWGFYTLSGFLMTLVLSEKYNDKGGLKKFALNRFLRIYPTYWIVLIMTLILVVLTIGLSDVNTFHGAMVIPKTFKDVLFNLDILGLSYGKGVRLVPPAWALSIEVTYYILIALLMSKSKIFTWVVFVISLVWFSVNLNRGIENYYSYIICGFPFAIGALLYYYKDVFKIDLELSSVYYYTMFTLAILGYFFFFYLVKRFNIEPYGIGLILNQIIVSVFVLVLYKLKFKEIKSIRKIDKILGDLSYPVYLIHWFVGYLIFTVFQVERGLNMVLIAIIPVVVLSYGINQIEKRINTLKK